MHDSAFRIGELVMRTYCDLPNAKILEIGSLNVNGCLRDAAEQTTHYIGVDLEEGPSVDVVIAPGAKLPLDSDSFDLVMASSVFEHDGRFWDTFVEMCRIARPGGHVYINAPSNGTVHRYPRDCWRFYPDAGLALADLARTHDIELDLVESFIGNRHSDVWNDFVAVFRKGPSAEPLNTAFIYHRYPALNARTWQSRAIHNESDGSEDMALISGLREQCDRLTEELAEFQKARNELADERSRRAAVEADRDRIFAHCDKFGYIEQQIEEVRTELADERSRRAAVEADRDRIFAHCDKSAYIEQQIEQARAELADERSRRASAEADRDRIYANFEEFANIEQQIEQARAELADERSRRAAVEADRDRLYAHCDKSAHIEQQLELVRTELADERSRRATAVTDRGAAGERRIYEGIAQLAALDPASPTLATNIAQLHHQWRDQAHPLAELADLLDTLASSARAFTRQKQALHDEIERLVRHIEERASAAREDGAQLAKHAELIETLRADHKREIRTLQTLEERVAQREREVEWLRRAQEQLRSGQSAIDALWPRKIRQQRLTRRLKQAGLFDAEAYLARYPDVAEAGIDPFRHYMLHGMSEGRRID